MKTFETKYLVISWEHNNYEKFDWQAFKHASSPFFQRYSKVIDFTIFNKRIVLEF